MSYLFFAAECIGYFIIMFKKFDLLINLRAFIIYEKHILHAELLKIIRVGNLKIIGIYHGLIFLEKKNPIK